MALYFYTPYFYTPYIFKKTNKKQTHHPPTILDIISANPIFKFI